MIMLSNSQTFIGLTPEWAAVIVGIIASVFAGLGYFQLIKSKADTQTQIRSLAEQATETRNVATSMAELAQSTNRTQEASRVNAMPWFKYGDYNFSGTESNKITITVSNIGLSTAFHVRMRNDPGSNGDLIPEKHNRVATDEKVRFVWEGSPGIEQGKVEACLWFSDNYGYRYVQRMDWIRGDVKFTSPQRSDDPNNLLPAYMKEDKLPTVWD